MGHMMPNLHLPVAATYLVGRERAALYAQRCSRSLVGVPTPLEKVDVVRNYTNGDLNLVLQAR